MNVLTFLLLATALEIATPRDASTPCSSPSPENGFRLAIDWEVAKSAEQGGGQFHAISNPDDAKRTAAPGCAYVGRLAPGPGRILLARSPSQRVLPEPTSSSSSDEGPSWLQPFSFFVSTTGVYDSNIDHDETPVRDWGLVYGAGTHFETDTVEVEYEIASHNYKNTDRWDRVSHSLTSSYEQKITRKLSMEAVGEMALRGSSEDRELGDQYILEPRIHYKVSPSSRVRLYGAYRLRRYDENPERDARNRYVGLELRNRLGRSTLDVGYRWETNRADGPRFTYDRQTYSAQLSTPLAGGLHRLGVELRYRPQQYLHRFLDDDETLRSDRRWVFTVGAAFALSRNIELLPGYKFETRTSNDPSKKFDAHAAYVGLRYWFGHGGNPAIANVQSAEPAAESPKREKPAKNVSAGSPPRRPEPPVRTTTVAVRAERRPAPVPPAAKRTVDWSKRAEAARQQLLRGAAGRYTVDVGVRCGVRTLEDAWRNDSPTGTLWLIPHARPDCFQLYWGRFSSLREAERAAATVPAYFRTERVRPSVVALTSEASAPVASRGIPFP